MEDFKVVPICEKQRRDVRESDLIQDGLYRKCDTYRGGGGYDKFPEIYYRRYGKRVPKEQFVVQLQGCPLNCPYCYVTKAGINGKEINRTGKEIVEDMRKERLKILHLMGGAPALYLDKWVDLLERLGEDEIFHSDFLLVENDYDIAVLEHIAQFKNQLYAVSIKGANKNEFERNTRTPFLENRFWQNLALLVKTQIPFYLTFTGMTAQSVNIFKSACVARFSEDIFADSFAIKLIHYKALD